MTQYTPNYNLDLYEGTDKPDLTDQYDNAMGKVDQVLKTSAGNVAELANKVGTLNETIATLNTQITNVNEELTALGITDAEGATALLAKINGYQTAIDATNSAVDENTNDIMKVDGMLAEVQADYVINTGSSIALQPPSMSGVSTDVILAVGENSTWIKAWGVITFANSGSSTTNVPLVPVPGVNGYFGIKLTPANPIPEAFRNRRYSYTGLDYQPINNADHGVISQLHCSYAVGNDGALYMAIQTNDTLSVQPSGRKMIYFQSIMMRNLPGLENVVA